MTLRTWLCCIWCALVLVVLDVPKLVKGWKVGKVGGMRLSGEANWQVIRTKGLLRGGQRDGGNLS